MKDAGYAGGISILKERLAKLRAPQREPVIRFETESGRQGQMDWSPYTINFTRTGKCQVQCFSYILGFSRRQYIDFTLRHDFYSLIRNTQYSGSQLENARIKEAQRTGKESKTKSVILPPLKLPREYFGV